MSKIESEMYYIVPPPPIAPYSPDISDWKESKLLSKPSKVIQELTFGNAATLVRQRPTSPQTRKEFEQIHVKLIEYNTALLESANDSTLIKTIHTFVKEKSSWLAASTQKGPTRLSCSHMQVLLCNFKMLHESLEKQQLSSKSEPQDVKMSADSVKKIDNEELSEVEKLVSSTLSELLEKEIDFYKTLPAHNEEAIQASFLTFKAKIKENPELGHQFLVTWINTHKVPQGQLKFTPEEFMGFVPYLSYLKS